MRRLIYESAVNHSVTLNQFQNYQISEEEICVQYHFLCESILTLWVWTGGPQPLFPSPLPPLPSPSSPTSLLLEYFSRPTPKSKKQQQVIISSYNLSFQCMDYYQSFKTVGQLVCLFLCWFVFEFYNLVNSPVDNIVVRPSCVCGEREKTKEDSIDERKNASIADPCPTIIRNNKMPRPQRCSQHGVLFYIYDHIWRNEDDFFHKTDKFSIDASDFCICYRHLQKLECLYWEMIKLVGNRFLGNRYILRND